MKFLYTLILGIFLTGCSNTNISEKQTENKKDVKKVETKEIEVVKKESKPEVEVINIKTEEPIIENIETKERIKTQKEIDFPERFNPTTGESIPKPF